MSNGLTPPPERDFPAGRLQQRKEQLVSEISSDSTVFVPSRRRRLLVLGVAIAVVGRPALAAASTRRRRCAAGLRPRSSSDRSNG